MMPAYMPMQMPSQHNMPMYPHQQGYMGEEYEESSSPMVQGAQAGGDCGCGVDGAGGPQDWSPAMGYGGQPMYPGYHHHGYPQHGYPQAYGPMQYPMGGWGPHQGGGPYGMGPYSMPQSMGSGYPQAGPMGPYQGPWRDDDVDES